MHPNENAKPSWIVTLASIAVVVAALYLAKGVLIPLTLAVLLSFLLSPLCDWLERGRLGRIPAVLLTAVLGFSVLGVTGWTAAVQMSHLAPKIPEYQNNLGAKLHSATTYAASLNTFEESAESGDQAESAAEADQTPRGTAEFPFSVRVLSSPTSSLQVFGGMFGTVLEVLGTAGIVVVLVVFFLIRREDLRDRFIRLVGTDQVTLTTQMLEDAGARVSRYLSMLFVINATYGIAVGIGLTLIGVPSAILWGILAAALRFIPYIGPWIAAAMPIALSMAISTGWVAPLITIAMFVVLELISNNVMEPWLYGKKTGVSAVAVLMAAVFWMWLWGPVGLLLATPLTVCLLVVGKHIPDLSFLNTLLGTDPVFEPKNLIYQRLLAGDQEEASDLLEEYLTRQTLVEVYDTVVIPALALAETHWRLGDLNEAKHDFITQSLKETFQYRVEPKQVPQTTQAADRSEPAADTDEDVPVDGPTEPRRLRILCMPARSDADEIAALFLTQILESRDRLVEALPLKSAAGEIADRVERIRPDVFCVSATPPAAVMHARHVCRQLRSRYPDLNLVVGLWDAQGDLDKSKERIGCDATVVTTLAAAQEHIRQMAPTLLPRTEKESAAGDRSDDQVRSRGSKPVRTLRVDDSSFTQRSK